MITKCLAPLFCALVLMPGQVSAFDPPFAWAGSMVLLTVTAPCGGRFNVADTPSIVFRPKLQAGEPNSALGYVFGYAAGNVSKVSPAVQFTGQGAYAGIFLSGRAVPQGADGNYNLSVSPPTVLSNTNFVSFSGSFSNFAGRVGCNVTVRGSAVRRG